MFEINIPHNCEVCNKWYSIVFIVVLNKLCSSHMKNSIFEVLMMKVSEVSNRNNGFI